MPTLWKTVWQFLKKLNIVLPYDSAFPFLGIYPEELKTGTITDNSYTNIHSHIIPRVKKWKQSMCSSTVEWINKMWYMHTMEYYSAIKRSKVVIHATTQMNLENIKPVTKGQVLYDSTSMKYLELANSYRKKVD